MSVTQDAWLWGQSGHSGQWGLGYDSEVWMQYIMPLPFRTYYYNPEELNGAYYSLNAT
jgi:hypothetical protein